MNEITDDQVHGSASGMLMSEQLAQSVRVLRRRWRIIALLPLLALVVSLVISLPSAKQYAATAKVVLNPVNEVSLLLNPASNVTPADPERNLNTAVSQITELPMANLVRSSLRLAESSHALLQQVSTAIEGTTNIVDIKVTDADPQRAAQLANAFAGQYVVYRLNNARSEIQQAVALAQARIAQLTPTQRAAATGQQLQARLALLQADSALLTPDAQVSEAAVPPSSPAQPRPLLDAVIAVIAGLLIAIVAVIALELLDRSVRDEEDASALSGLIGLGVIPKPRSMVIKRDGRARVPAIHGHGADSSSVRHTGSRALDWEQEESYTSLAVSLLSLRLASEENIVMIVSPGPQDGKTSVTIGLAAALAQLGQRVIAVECDLRRPRFAEYLGLPRGKHGLTSILAGSTTVEAGLVDVDAGTHRPVGSQPRPSTEGPTSGATVAHGVGPHFTVLPSGPIPPNAQALLRGAEVPPLLRQLQSTADIVLIDTPPLGVVKDALLLAGVVDQVAVVARVGYTSRDALKRCRTTLDQVGVGLLGIVIVGGGRGALSYYDRSRRGTFATRPKDQAREGASVAAARTTTDPPNERDSGAAPATGRARRRATTVLPIDGPQAPEDGKPTAVDRGRSRAAGRDQ